MTTRGKIRASAFALALGGILVVVSFVTHPLGETSQYVSSALWVPSHVVGYFAFMLVLFGILGLYAWQSEKIGRLGLVGFVFAFVGIVNIVGGVLWVGALVQPMLAADAPSINDSFVSPSSPALIVLYLSFVLFLVGYVLLGLASFRAKMLPHWVLWLVIASVIGVFVAVGGAAVYVLGSIGGVVEGISLAGWGYALWSGTRAARIVNP